MTDVSLDQLSFEQFSALVKTKFRVRTGPDGFVEVELTEATRSTQGTPPGKSGTASQTECISLIFHGPGSRFLPQQAYSFAHDLLGRVELFMVPVSQVPDGFQYQVLINRLCAPR